MMPAETNIFLLKNFQNHLYLERALAQNSIQAYTNDIQKLIRYLEIKSYDHLSVKDISVKHVESFLRWLTELGLAESSQSRILSALRAFYRFLNDHEITENNPVQHLSAPITARKLPVVLSVEEIVRLTDVIDLSTSEGIRNRAIIEILYGSGLRVTELVNLRLSNCDFESRILKIRGKGNKERFVPIHQQATHYLTVYLDQVRHFQKIKTSDRNVVFLNRRGSALSRVMIFMIIKDLGKKAGLYKNISPHTFRHSFATHLIEGGADLRAVQELLGHESILTTEIYTHLDMRFLQDTIQHYHPRSQ